MSEPLSLPEQYLLLCLDEETGRFADGHPNEALNAAALMELLQLGRISRGRVTRGREDLVTVRSAEPTGDPFLDRLLASIDADRERHSVSEWLVSTDSPSNTHLVLERLMARRIVRKEGDGRFLGLFPRFRYPAENPVPKQLLRKELLTAIYGTEPVDQRPTALYGLLWIYSHPLYQFIPQAQEAHLRDRYSQLCFRDALDWPCTRFAKPAPGVIDSSACAACLLRALLSTHCRSISAQRTEGA